MRLRSCSVADAGISSISHDYCHVYLRIRRRKGGPRRDRRLCPARRPRLPPGCMPALAARPLPLCCALGGCGRKRGANMASKTGKLLGFINYRAWAPARALGASMLACSSHRARRQGQRTPGRPDHRSPLAPLSPPLAAGMRVTVSDGRQIVGRCVGRRGAARRPHALARPCRPAQCRSLLPSAGSWRLTAT